MNISLGFGILLFAAIGIGMMGTLTKVMSQQYEAICPPGYAADPKQTPSDMADTGFKSCVNDKGQVKDVPQSPAERAKVCMSLGRPENC